VIPFAEPHAVYRIFGDDDRLLYVGRSRWPAERIRQHARRAAWWPHARRHEVTWHPDKDTATVAERRAIQAERPAHNVRIGDYLASERQEMRDQIVRRRVALRRRPWLIPADVGDLC
jgi:hypothetical protein